MMTHKERFYATIECKPVDRPASWLGLPTPGAVQNLIKHFQVNDFHEVSQMLDDDIYPVELPYHSPTSDAIYMAFDFAQQGHSDDEHRTLNSPGFFQHYSDPARVDDFDWPDPAKYISPEECRRVVEAAPQDRVILGVIWSAHFQDACAAFGMETALVKMMTEPEMFQVVIDRIADFYLKANEIFYEATKGKLNAVLIGNDFGSQQGLMLSPKLIRKFVWSGTRRLVEQAKSYGLKVIHHSCGSIYPIIQDLIDIGVDAIHPIQALAKDMSAEHMKEHFYGKVAFCGGVDAQELIVHGTPEQVYQRVKTLKALFPTGLIISPSHEAILPDVDPANIEAIFNALKA
ncbi:uroporphyrinogen-III decarboxylase [Candidatus Moduliflexus flocculans]|uniref:Uroporphyrinogen-III decarboxylase n=1 Tax=Candidatus Moduliflexus flocculans TaxID=1499966 RepID=A0A081BRH3_9BACT|nr:uroporphyrinogen-III decarboxylase [Candidatus Moduliflexus flocculans]